MVKELNSLDVTSHVIGGGMLEGDESRRSQPVFLIHFLWNSASTTVTHLHLLTTETIPE